MSSIRQKGISEQSRKKLSENFELSQKQPRNIRDVMIVLGGWLHKKATNSIEWFDVEKNKWIRSSLQLPLKLAYHGAAIIDEILYVYGGSDGTRFRCETWKLNPETWTWEQCDPMFEARNFITNSSVVFEKKIYVFGGQNGREYAANMRDHTRSRTGEFYDPKIDKWTKTAQMNDMRSDCGAVVYDNQIYIIGGFDGHSIIPTVEVYNPYGDFFIIIDSLPTPLSGHSVLIHNSQLVVIGGFDGRTRQDKILTWSKRGEWIEHENKMKAGRSTSSACSYRGVVVTIGGYSKYVDDECEVLLGNGEEYTMEIPSLLKNKSACKVIIGENWRSKLEEIGTVDIEENHDSVVEEELQMETE
ncbi:unnamed protein product [Caenorhabditis angaria]|uniref:Uncharacterized protein n=1 Tax=Caenorhabditis angaria TaxID=860376 RepID=A0A9P1IBM4_9PELO|nr:unnamed protein product [Caenorhabditis angaria]